MSLDILKVTRQSFRKPSVRQSFRKPPVIKGGGRRVPPPPPPPQSTMYSVMYFNTFSHFRSDICSRVFVLVLSLFVVRDRTAPDYFQWVYSPSRSDPVLMAVSHAQIMRALYWSGENVPLFRSLEGRQFSPAMKWQYRFLSSV